MLLPDLHWVNALRPLRLALMARPRGGDELADEMRGLVMVGVQTLVSLLEAAEARELELQAEAAACAAAGLGFRHYPIRDRGVPPSTAHLAEALQPLLVELRAGVALAVHCRAGIGRTGLVAACLLVELGRRPAEVFELLSRARGVEVPDTDEQVAWLQSYARDREAARMQPRRGR